MGKKILILLCFTILSFTPNLALADCVSMGAFNSWFVEDSHNIVFYRGSTPLARLHIPECNINGSSRIHLIKSYVCDSDKIIIDGEECTIMTV